MWLQALLAAANLLDVMAVREACCRFMECQMDETNCVGIHCFAEAHSCKVLEKRSMDYILEHFGSVYQQVRRELLLDLSQYIFFMKANVIRLFFFCLISGINIRLGRPY